MFALVNDARAQTDHVGFFQGTAGIGFQLLQFAYPDLLPSPLLIE
jgi:lantibiotic modifying enzyme